jgi:hypothetical protein
VQQKKLQTSPQHNKDMIESQMTSAALTEAFAFQDSDFLVFCHLASKQAQQPLTYSIPVLLSLHSFEFLQQTKKKEKVESRFDLN